MKTTLQARIEKCRGSARFSQEVQELLLRECELAEEKLSAQESELTKLRKRVEVLSELLGRTTSYIEHYASECRSIKDNDRSHMDLLIEIHKAKIAESKELDDPESFERECGSSGV